MLWTNRALQPTRDALGFVQKPRIVLGCSSGVSEHFISGKGNFVSIQVQLNDYENIQPCPSNHPMRSRFEFVIAVRGTR